MISVKREFSDVKVIREQRYKTASLKKFKEENLEEKNNEEQKHRNFIAREEKLYLKNWQVNQSMVSFKTSLSIWGVKQMYVS